MTPAASRRPSIACRPAVADGAERRRHRRALPRRAPATRGCASTSSRSVDGAATHQGLSGGLSDDVDQPGLRDPAPALRRGARRRGHGARRGLRRDAGRCGVRAGAERGRDDGASGVRDRLGRPRPRPARAPIFADAPERPIVLTTELSAAGDARGALRGRRRRRLRTRTGGSRARARACCTSAG